MSTVREDRSLPELFSDLTRDTATLFRQEVQLAKAEMSEKLDTARAGLVSLVIGGVLALAGLMKILDAAVYALSNVVYDWAAALIVGGVVALIGLVLVMAGRKTLKDTSLTPTRTVESLRRDKDVAKEQLL